MKPAFGLMDTKFLNAAVSFRQLILALAMLNDQLPEVFLYYLKYRV
jgi:hypothetical protein